MIRRKILIVTLTLVMASGSAFGRRYYHYHTQYTCPYPPRVTTIIRPVHDSRPTHISRITKRDRYDMALAYLKSNTYMTVKQYAKITGLKKEIAEAELNVFVQDISSPIKPVPGKKNLYYLRP